MSARRSTRIERQHDAGSITRDRLGRHVGECMCGWSSAPTWYPGLAEGRLLAHQRDAS